ncbi:MAG TPA: peptide ABC transporter substrate-binding protein, partial [Herpetosiphonaceae bacterium]
MIKRVMYVALLTLLLPILAACGGPATTATTAPTTGAAPTTAPAETPTQAAETAPTEAPTAGAETAAPAPTDAPAEAGNILRVHQITYPDVFDPQKSSFSGEIVILSQNYEGLTRLDGDLKTVPAAAEKWEYNADATVITFTLRSGLKYSDGSPLTAANFAYAASRTCDPNTAGEYQSILFDIAGCADFASTAVTDTAGLETTKAALGVKAVDDTTLVINLVQPAPYFHTVASLWVMYPAKQELIEKGGENWWQSAENHIGNGPFQISKITEDQEVDFVANKNYWNGAPKLDGLKYIYVADPAVALEAYKAGQLDTYIIDPSQIPALQDDASLKAEYLSYPAATTQGLQFNHTLPPFDDAKVREAFAYAFDRETYCAVIRNGDCQPTLTWIPQGIPGFDDTEDRFAFDADKAKAALAESKYAAAMPEITLAYNSDSAANKERHEFIAKSFQETLGIEVKLNPMPGKDLSAARKDFKTAPQMFLGGWIGDYPDPQNWLSVYWRSDAFASRVGYGNKEADELMKVGDTSTDPAERIKAYQAAQKLIVGDVAMVMV